MRTMHFKFKPLIGFLLVIFLFCSPIFAAEPTILGQVTLSDTERFTLAAENIDQTFQIDVSFPMGYKATSEDYPVVYLLDGNFMFPVVDYNLKSLHLGAEIPAIILVAIGYEVENELESMVVRTRDLTPSIDAVQAEIMWNAPPPFTLPENISPGGAGEFLEFINNELKPVINSRYRADPTDQTLAALQFGGMIK